MIDADRGNVIIVIDDRCRSWYCRNKCRSSSSPSTSGGNVVIVIDDKCRSWQCRNSDSRCRSSSSPSTSGGNVVIVIDADRGNVVIVIDADRGSVVIVIDDRCRLWQCRDSDSRCRSSSSPSMSGGNVVIVIDADRGNVVLVIDADHGNVIIDNLSSTSMIMQIVFLDFTDDT